MTAPAMHRARDIPRLAALAEVARKEGDRT